MISSDHLDPAMERRRLRVELRRARVDAGRTQREVAEAMDWSVSKVVRIENGEVVISRNDLKVLLDYYGIVNPRAVDALLDTAKVAKEDPWSRFRHVYSAAFLTYLGFESSAWIIRSYQPILIPGLLQTEEYAWAIQTGVLSKADEAADLRWEARQRRFKVHELQPPPKMFFILDEAVIRRQVGGPGVMRRQLEQLKEFAAQPHITLQVIPFEMGGYERMGVPFVYLEFQSSNEENVLYLEHAVERTVRDEPEETGPYLTRFLELERHALSESGTSDLMNGVIAELATRSSNNERTPAAGSGDPKGSGKADL